MKKLQNNFTTPEQSKRLLELGVPEDSADLILIREKSGDMQFYDNEFEKQVLNWDEKFSDWDTVYWHSTHHVLPCWSVGRLIEIVHLCSGSTLSYKEEADELKKFKEAHKCETIIEAIIMCIEDACSIGGMDFSKLED